MISLESQLQGLVWVQKTFGLEPRWGLEPDIGAVRQTIQSLWPSSTIEVTILGQGAFNKLYNVEIDDQVFVMRVSLPVDPYYKTMSEVSTVDWIYRTTNIPVPQVITYKSSRDNPIGFEWILMTKMPGKALGETWKSLSFAAKTSLVKKFAAYFACLFQNQLRGIGNIYRASSIPNDSASAEETWPTRDPVYSNKLVPVKERGSDHGIAPSFTSSEKQNLSGGLPDVGRIVSMQFFWGSHILQDIHRGPFRSSKDWITSRLSLSENDCRSILEKLPAGDLDSDDEDEAEDATRTLQIIEKLKCLLPLVFPSNGDHSESSIIFHDDLSRQNILVHNSGELAGILDWECVSALPLWKACYYPAFLEGPPRRLEPNPKRYSLEADGEPSDLYWDHLWQYEVTLLRDIFVDEMKRLEPEWVDVFDKSHHQRDFDIAVQNCDNELVARQIHAWIDDINAGVGNLRSLRDRIDED